MKNQKPEYRNQKTEKKNLLITIHFILTILVLAWLILPKPVCLGATYYVDANNGSDSNLGTIDQPFRTIQKGVDTASSGDVIYIYEGTYHESISIDKDNLTITGRDPSNPPVLDGADQTFNPTWELVQGKIYKISYAWPYEHLDTDSELRIVYYSQMHSYFFTGENCFPMQVYEDESLLRGYARTGGADSPVFAYYDLEHLDPASATGISVLPYSSELCKPDIRIPGRFMYRESEGELYVWCANEDHPDNHTYHIPVIPYLFTIKARGTALRNLVIRYASSCAILMDNADNSVIENCYFINNHNAIYTKNTDNLTIRRNLFQHKGYWERYWYNDSKSTLISGAQVFIMASNNQKIYENTFYGGSYVMEIGGDDISVYRNIFSHATHSALPGGAGYGTGFNFGRNRRVYQNIVNHQDQCSLDTQTVYTGPLWCYRNVFYNCWGVTKVWGSEYNPGEPKVFIYHNTIAFSARVIYHWYAAASIKKEQVWRNNIFHLDYKRFDFFNNIMNRQYGRYFKTLRIDGWRYFPFEDGPDLDYNIYWIPGQNPELFTINATDINGMYIDKTYRAGDFPLMSSEMQIETHGRHTDPLFLNQSEFDTVNVDTLKFDHFSDMNYWEIIREGYDKLFAEHFDKIYYKFTLSKDSPAINCGETLPADWPDIVDITDGQPDIGAYEYGAPSPNQSPVADAGPNQTVTDEDNNGKEQVTLDGSGSKDPDGNIVSYVWTEGGLQIAIGVKPTVTLSTGTHSITLKVTDDGGLTDTDTVTIKVLKGDREFGELPTGCYNNVINPSKGEKAIIVAGIEKQDYIRIAVYDTKGNKIKELVDKEKDPGIYKYYWYGEDGSGNIVGNGLYFVHIQAGNYKKTKKVVVIK